MAISTTDRDVAAAPTRAALVDQAAAADLLVTALRDAGLPSSRVTIVSDTENVRLRFRAVNAQPSAGSRTPAAVLIGAVAGLALGLAGAAVAGLFQTGDRAQLLVGALFPFAAAVIGGFVGAMMTRGAELESADYYDQESLPGQILVAVELETGDPPEWLRRAEEAFERHRARSIPLARG